MDDERTHDEEPRDADELKLPPERMEDLELDENASEDVKAGAFKQGFPVKWQGTP